MKAIKPAAEKFRGQIIFVYLDSAKKDNAQILDFFGLKEDDCPTYLIYEVGAASFSPSSPKHVYHLLEWPVVRTYNYTEPPGRSG